MTIKPRKSRKKIVSEAPELVDATPERLERAEESGQKSETTRERARRLLDPFDVMRTTRALAPHDPKLNDTRWLIGEALRRLYDRARLDNLRAVSTESFISSGFVPRPGLPASEAALHARDKIRAAADRVGPAAWPILSRIIIEGAGVRDCRKFIPEVVTPWRADAVVTDRLRVALDLIGALVGVVAGRR